MQGTGTPLSNTEIRQFITEYEGINVHEYQDPDNIEIEALIADMILDENSEQVPEDQTTSQ